MDDLAEKINTVLSDPESLKQLGEIAQMLGFSPDQAPTPPQPSPPSEDTGPSDFSMPDIASLMTLASRLKDAGTDDDNINFLTALRPLLSDDKKPRIDRAIKILKLINLLPVLKDSGILGGDLLGIL